MRKSKDIVIYIPSPYLIPALEFIREAVSLSKFKFFEEEKCNLMGNLNLILYSDCNIIRKYGLKIIRGKCMESSSGLRIW